MREIALNEMERLAALTDAERTFHMNEEAFRIFYDQTARPIWLYLARMSGNGRLADDLLQETYYRFLRANASFDSDDHRRRYLYRIATNLVHDHRRRPRADVSLAEDRHDRPSPWGNDSETIGRRIDLTRAMSRLKPRERSLLWLAYAQGCSHEEIAAVLGLRTSSLKSLLHRARKRLMTFLTVSPSGDPS